MKKIKKTNINNFINRATMFVLLSCLLSSKVYADGEFSYFDVIEKPSVKLINPIYLDPKLKEENKSLTGSQIPFNLRKELNESDYFSSSAFETIQANAPPKMMNLENLPSPSEFKKTSYISNKKEENFDKEISNSIFSPLENSLEVDSVEKNDKNIAHKEENIQSFEIVDESVYMASACSQNIDVEGKKISKIKIIGLKTVPESFILEQISSQEGGMFNSEKLQLDLQKIYATGFFSDTMSIEPILNTNGTITLTFILEENILIKNIYISGNHVVTTAELIPFISRMQNKPQNLREINLAINNIHNYYHEKGYILANVCSVDDDKDGNLTFTILEGVINKIDISGNEHTKDYVIKRNILTEPGSIYNEEYLKKDLAKVFSTQIFEEVNRNIKPSEEKSGTYDVTIIVKEKSTNSVGFGGGIDTGLGAFGSISFKEDNFLGKAQKLSLSGILGSGILLNDASIKNHMNYQAELSFFEPYFLNADNSLMTKLYFREMGSWNIPLAIEKRIGFRTGIEHKVKNNDHLKTSFSTGIEYIGLKEGDYGKISQLYAINNLNISERAKQLSDGFFFNLTPGIRYSNLDNDEIPREGIIAQAQFNEAIGISNFKHTNGRLNGAVTKFFPVFKKSSFSITGKAGIKVHGDDMPEIMAYRLGGPYSIRGFRMHGVGAGESFVMGSAELATPLPMVDRLKWDFIKKMRLTFFVDAGKVFDPTISNVLYDRPLHAITAGIGLRMYIPGIGPMSIDYGLPIINPGKYGSEHGYFTFGTGGMNMYGYGY